MRDARPRHWPVSPVPQSASGQEGDEDDHGYGDRRRNQVPAALKPLPVLLSHRLGCRCRLTSCQPVTGNADQRQELYLAHGAPQVSEPEADKAAGVACAADETRGRDRQGDILGGRSPSSRCSMSCCGGHRRHLPLQCRPLPVQGLRPAVRTARRQAAQLPATQSDEPGEYLRYTPRGPGWRSRRDSRHRAETMAPAGRPAPRQRQAFYLRLLARHHAVYNHR